MDKGRTESQRVKLPFEIIGNGLDKRILVALMVSGMDVQPRGLIDRKNPVILEENAVFR